MIRCCCCQRLQHTMLLVLNFICRRFFSLFFPFHFHLILFGQSYKVMKFNAVMMCVREKETNIIIKWNMNFMISTGEQLNHSRIQRLQTVWGLWIEGFGLTESEICNFVIALRCKCTHAVKTNGEMPLYNANHIIYFYALLLPVANKIQFHSKKFHRFVFSSFHFTHLSLLDIHHLTFFDHFK